VCLNLRQHRKCGDELAVPNCISMRITTAAVKTDDCINISCGSGCEIDSYAVSPTVNVLNSKVHLRTGHEREERCNCTLSLTSALDGGGRSTPRPGRFTPGNDSAPIV